MKPIIKWPGGKSKELKYVRELMPRNFNRYIEPFFGGGAVFFDVKPQRAVVNDLCRELTLFYRFVKGELDQKVFKEELYVYVDAWENVANYMALFTADLLVLYNEYRNGHTGYAFLQEQLRHLLSQYQREFDLFFHEEFIINKTNLLHQITDNLTSKLKRVKSLEKIKGTLPLEDLADNFESAVRSGFYMHFRDVLNNSTGEYALSEAKKAANYYFIREFCYGAMFRFNSQGEFNIPYGGIAYNRKDFRKKVDLIFSPEVQRLLADTIIENLDFEEFFNKYYYDKNDFVFLDPPYDSDFSEYEQNTFNQDDQKRLACLLYNLKAKFILIIKNTDFIVSLYRDKPGIKITSFDKTYLYNVRGRNNRDTQHLIIYNY
ncbi:MAG: DNA adenine methylase [Bacillota bacterium]